MNEEEYHSKIYVGVRFDAEAVGGRYPSDLVAFVCFLDLPLSLVLDTAILPGTLIYELFRDPDPLPGERRSP